MVRHDQSSCHHTISENSRNYLAWQHLIFYEHFCLCIINSDHICSSSCSDLWCPGTKYITKYQSWNAGADKYSYLIAEWCGVARSLQLRWLGRNGNKSFLLIIGQVTIINCSNMFRSKLSMKSVYYRLLSLLSWSSIEKCWVVVVALFCADITLESFRNGEQLITIIRGIPIIFNIVAATVCQCQLLEYDQIWYTTNCWRTNN